MTGKSGKKETNSTSSKLNTIVLYDSSFDINELINIVKEKNPLVISFNYESHKFLIKHKIKHKLEHWSWKHIKSIFKKHGLALVIIFII